MSIRPSTRSLLLLALPAALLAACATDSYQDPYKDPLVVEAFGEQELDLSNRPGILDGMFERMRTDPDSMDEQRVAELEEAVRRLEARERTPEATPPAEGLRHRVGLLVDAQDREAVEDAFTRAAGGKAVALHGADSTRDALAEANCDTGRLLECADALAIYPGLRLVMQISVDEQGEARWRTLDTALGWQSSEQSISLPTGSDGIPDLALESLVDRMLRSGLERTRAAPWQARVFNDDNNMLAINAGRESGLRAGDTLTVTEPGRLLRGPAGQPAGWLPGDAIGQVRVQSLAGDDVAIVAVVDGERPTTRHLLLSE
ncbi:MAG: hypothetical protein JJU06_08045 [Ectothiorhodospiraceae bacterium]|nr:hypothetical protein [Ectothiorhodospiraceae bacterium]